MIDELKTLSRPYFGSVSSINEKKWNYNIIIQVGHLNSNYDVFIRKRINNLVHFPSLSDTISRNKEPRETDHVTMPDTN